MNPPIDPKLLKPCPECKNDLIYIKGGISHYSGEPYEAYYRCYNKCKTLKGHSLWPVRFNASAAKYYLKNKP